MPSHLIVGDGIITVVGIVFVARRVTGVSIVDQGGCKGLGPVVISVGFGHYFTMSGGSVHVWLGQSSCHVLSSSP